MPWKRKDLYKASPVSKYEIAKIPAITIAGAIWIAFSILVVVLFAREPRLFFVQGWVASVLPHRKLRSGGLILFRVQVEEQETWNQHRTSVQRNTRGVKNNRVPGLLVFNLLELVMC